MSNGQSSVSVLFAAAAIIMCSLLGCTVKEDRDNCPSILILDMRRAWDAAGRSGFGDLVVCVRGDDFDYSETVAPGAEECRITVPREMLVVDVYGVEGMSARKYVSGGFHAEPGEEFPPLWRFSGVVEVSGERAGMGVSLHKDFCRMLISVNEIDDRSVSPYVLDFTSGVDGVLPGGVISENVLSFSINPGAGNEVAVRIPRQKDGSLRLDLDSGDGVRRFFPVGGYIISSGYDWTAEDLDDITMKIDYSLTSVNASISGWDKTHVFVVEI